MPSLPCHDSASASQGTWGYQIYLLMCMHFLFPSMFEMTLRCGCSCSSIKWIWANWHYSGCQQNNHARVLAKRSVQFVVPSFPQQISECHNHVCLYCCPQALIVALRSNCPFVLYIWSPFNAAYRPSTQIWVIGSLWKSYLLMVKIMKDIFQPQSCCNIVKKVIQRCAPLCDKRTVHRKMLVHMAIIIILCRLYS